MRTDNALSVDIDGIQDAIRDMQRFEPDLWRRLSSRARRAVISIKNEAAQIYPKGAWTITGGRQKLIAKRGILASIEAEGGSRVDNDWGASDPGVKASLFEFIGKKYSGGRSQVAGLVSSLDRRYRPISQGGRFIWNAYDRDGAGINAELAAEVERAEAELNRRFQSNWAGA